MGAETIEEKQQRIMELQQQVKKLSQEVSECFEEMCEADWKTDDWHILQLYSQVSERLQQAIQLEGSKT